MTKPPFHTEFNPLNIDYQNHTLFHLLLIIVLLGQLALCDQDDQNVRQVVQHNLAFFNDRFGGWSSLARQTAAVYGLPDPLQYMGQPWPGVQNYFFVQYHSFLTADLSNEACMSYF